MCSLSGMDTADLSPERRTDAGFSPTCHPATPHQGGRGSCSGAEGPGHLHRKGVAILQRSKVLWALHPPIVEAIALHEPGHPMAQNVSSLPGEPSCGSPGLRIVSLAPMPPAVRKDARVPAQACPVLWWLGVFRVLSGFQPPRRWADYFLGCPSPDLVEAGTSKEM